jgi:hypothetical protein
MTVTTPAQVSKAQLHKHIAKGKWSFAIELMFDVIGTVTKVESHCREGPSADIRGHPFTVKVVTDLQCKA